MNHESTETGSKDRGSTVIKPWLSGGLIVALVGNFVLSGVLILQLSTFEDTRRQAQEVEAGIAKARTELATLQVEVESLTKQKEALAPTIVDWEKRVKEKAEAEALLATSEAKKRQIESDIVLNSQRLGEVNQNLVSAEKQQSELNTEIEKLRGDLASVTKTKMDAEAVLAMAREAERRWNEAQNALTSAEARRKQLETEASQSQKEVDDARQVHDKLNTDAATLRQQVKTLKDELSASQSDLQARQAAVQEEEQKLTKLQTNAKDAERRSNEAQNAVTSAEARRKQLETDASQLQKEVDDARQVHDKLNTDAATLRQQIQTLKDELAASQSQSSELQARQAAVQQEEQKLTKLQQQVTSAETRLNELNEQEEKQRRESEELTNRLEQIHKEVTDGELRRDTAKADFQKADSDLASARKLLQEISSKHDELIRESSDLETVIDRLTKEKETKEKELGQLDAQRPTSQKADQ